MTDAPRPVAVGWALPARLQGWRLVALRLTWSLAAVGLILLVTVGFVRAFREPHLAEIAAVTELLQTLGLDVRLMMALALVVPFVAVVVVAAVVFGHRSDDPSALLFMMILLVLFASSSRSLLTFEGDAVLRHAHAAAFALTMVGLAAVLAFFPDGRFVPRWTWWLVPATALCALAFPDAVSLLDEVAAGRASGRGRALMLAFLGVIGLGVLAQVRRYRHVSDATARQQAKWVMVPLSLWIGLLMVGGVPVAVFGVDERWLAGIVLFAALPLGVLFPVAVGLAVLRYRLYEIDRIVSRTISYGLVVGVLGGVYAAGAVAFGAAVSRLAGPEESGLVVAASVLAVVVLFRPVRTRVQRAVDRRFNRTGYEARRAVASFPHTLRDRVELDAIRVELESTVARTVQPTHVSIWLVAPKAPHAPPVAGAR